MPQALEKGFGGEGGGALGGERKCCAPGHRGSWDEAPSTCPGGSGNGRLWVGPRNLSRPQEPFRFLRLEPQAGTTVATEGESAEGRVRLVLRWIPSERGGVSAWHCRVGDFERLQAGSERTRRKPRSSLSPQALPQGKTVAEEFLFPSDLHFFFKFSGDFKI